MQESNRSAISKHMFKRYIKKSKSYFDTKMYTSNPPVKRNNVQMTLVTPVNSDFQLFSPFSAFPN